MVAAAQDEPQAARSLDEDINQVLEANGGDPRAAIGSMIVMIDFLEERLRRAQDNISRGFVRGHGGPPR